MANKTNNHKTATAIDDDPDALKALDALDAPAEEPFDLAEWGVASDYTDELMASTALEHLDIVQTTEINIKGNKTAHRDDEVNRLFVAQAASQAALNAIKQRHPGAIPIVRELTLFRARQARQVREAAAKAAKD